MVVMMRRFLLFVLSCAFLLATAAPARAVDWQNSSINVWEYSPFLGPYYLPVTVTGEFFADANATALWTNHQILLTTWNSNHNAGDAGPTEADVYVIESDHTDGPFPTLKWMTTTKGAHYRLVLTDAKTGKLGWATEVGDEGETLYRGLPLIPGFEYEWRLEHADWKTPVSKKIQVEDFGFGW